MTQGPEVRAAHPYHMYDAILAQPNAIERVLVQEADAVGELASAVTRAERVHLVGIGTSWHAALVGAHLLRTVGGRPDARAWNSFEFCHYPPPLSPSDVVIVLTHRGTKRFSLRALALAKGADAVTAVVTGLGSAVDPAGACLAVHTSPQETSAAFTVSHTTAMTVLAMLAQAVGTAAGVAAAQELGPALEQLHVLTEWAVATELRVRTLAAQVRDARWFTFAGWGPNVATAYEAALKMNEAAYALATGYQMEQLMHGPAVAADGQAAAVLVVTPGEPRARALEAVDALNAIGAYTIVLADEADRGAAERAQASVPLPSVPEALTPIAYLPPLQLLAYYLAVEHGHNPDRFPLDEPGHQAAHERFPL